MQAIFLLLGLLNEWIKCEFYKSHEEIEDETLQKFRYAAKRNLRSINSELEKIIKKYIAEYEKRYGKIE